MIQFSLKGEASLAHRWSSLLADMVSELRHVLKALGIRDED